jgi:hypothetical protein
MDYPIVDMTDGEVLAADDAERQDVLELMCAELIELERHVKRLAEVRRKVALLMTVGDSVARNGYAIACELGPRPKRQINRQEIQAHAEALAPLGLGTREETTVVYPTVAQLTTTKARAALARAGLNVNTFLLEGGEPSPVVKVYAPEEVEL